MGDAASGSQTSYGPAVAQTVEWMGTVRPTRPTLIVAVHGGYWRARYGLDHLQPFCAALANLGFPVASLEYRRLGEAGGGWPGTLEDVEHALAAIAEKTAADALPVKRTVLVGHSAGGQLALWAASRARVRSGRYPLVGLLALAAVSDLVEASRLNLSEGVVREFLGGSPEEVPERYRQASPVELLPLGVPTVVVHGTDDRDVPYALSPAYVKRARAAGDDVRLTTLEGAGHFDVIEPESPYFPQVLDAVQSLA